MVVDVVVQHRPQDESSLMMAVPIDLHVTVHGRASKSGNAPEFLACTTMSRPQE